LSIAAWSLDFDFGSRNILLLHRGSHYMRCFPREYP
jgi:hypothetical protein